MKKYKEISIKETIVYNSWAIVYVFGVLTYMSMCFYYLELYQFSEPFLRLPFIIIIAFSAIQLVPKDFKTFIVKKGQY